MWPAESQKSRRREREASLSRDRKRKREKEHSKDEKRDKQDKQDKQDKHAKQEKHDRRDGYDRERGSDRKRDYDGYAYGDRRDGSSRGHDGRDADRNADRNRGGRDGRPEDARKRDKEDKDKKPKEVVAEVEIPPIEAAVVEPPAKEAPPAKSAKKDWREEMQDEDERDLSDDDAATAKKLEESRKRREAMMAKWVNAEAKEKDDKEAKEVGGTAEKDDSDSDAGIVAAKKDGEGVSSEQKQEVQKFILEQRASKEKDAQGDMFGESAENAKKLNSGLKQSEAIGLTGASGDDWNDQDGYYLAKIGEVMDDRYLVVENVCGKGVFSNVVKCKDQKEKDEMVAIKVMRENDMMKKAAEKEIEILQLLNNNDRGNKRHCIRLLSTFYYRKHLCLVFECMWDDLRAALKKYTKGKGMALQAIRAYTKQLIIGLRHMHKCGIIHADIKPDNILISEGHNIVKFCDLGTALEVKDVAVTPYLVSRFYRAPEIILGCEYSFPVDVFALGATLFELFTGKIIFNSKNNNDALKKIMEVKGKIPKNVIKKGMLWKTHFDENLDFKYEDVDKYTKKEMTRTITDLRVTRDLFDLLVERVGREKLTSEAKEDTQTIKRIKQFADLLHQMLAIDPEKRITANDALSHPFLEDRLGKGVADSGDRGAPGRR